MKICEMDGLKMWTRIKNPVLAQDMWPLLEGWLVATTFPHGHYFQIYCTAGTTFTSKQGIRFRYGHSFHSQVLLTLLPGTLLIGITLQHSMHP
jgi:hypothetical protein